MVQTPGDQVQRKGIKGMKLVLHERGRNWLLDKGKIQKTQNMQRTKNKENCRDTSASFMSGLIEEKKREICKNPSDSQEK